MLQNTCTRCATRRKPLQAFSSGKASIGQFILGDHHGFWGMETLQPLYPDQSVTYSRNKLSLSRRTGGPYRGSPSNSTRNSTSHCFGLLNAFYFLSLLCERRRHYDCHCYFRKENHCHGMLNAIQQPHPGGHQSQWDSQQSSAD